MTPVDVTSEFGVIRIPGRRWASLVTAIWDVQIRLMRLQYKQALDICNHLKEARRHRRNFDWHEEYRKATVRMADPGRVIFNSLFMRDGIHLARPRKPRKKDFRVLRKSAVFSFGILRLRLDDATNTLVWEIPPGKGSVERAYELQTTLELIELLQSLVWVNRTGGVLWRESYLAGATISVRFGPIGASYGVTKTDRRRSSGLRPQARRGLPLLYD